MALSRSGARPFVRGLAVCLSLALLASCASRDVIEPAEYEDDFGDSMEIDEITEQSVAETTMLHQHAQFDVQVGAVVPIEGNFNTGAGVTGTFGLEIFKNLYSGLELSYSHHEVDQGATEAVVSDNTADQLYKSIDRISILANFDYDVPLTRPSTEFGAMTFRAGLGAGLLVVSGTEDEFIQTQLRNAGSDFEVNPFFGLLIRPSVEFRVRVWEHGHVFAGLSYDWTPQQTIDVEIGGDKREVTDTIQFDAINFGVGFSFEW